jgi:hypothetical protein
LQIGLRLGFNFSTASDPRDVGMPGFDDNKPKFPPPYEIHIAPSTTFGTTSTSAPKDGADNASRGLVSIDP